MSVLSNLADLLTCRDAGLFYLRGSLSDFMSEEELGKVIRQLMDVMHEHERKDRKPGIPLFTYMLHEDKLRIVVTQMGKISASSDKHPHLDLEIVEVSPSDTQLRLPEPRSLQRHVWRGLLLSTVEQKLNTAELRPHKRMMLNHHVEGLHRANTHYKQALRYDLELTGDSVRIIALHDKELVSMYAVSN